MTLRRRGFGSSDLRSAAVLVDFLDLGAASIRGYLSAGPSENLSPGRPTEQQLLAAAGGAGSACTGTLGDAMEILVLQPIVALIAGILILIMPHLLNYIVAIYLILIGLVGLFGQLG
jgi:hypothetical protein